MTVQKEIIQRISALPQNALTELLAHLERIEEVEKKKISEDGLKPTEIR